MQVNMWLMYRGYIVEFKSGNEIIRLVTNNVNFTTMTINATSILELVNYSVSDSMSSSAQCELCSVYFFAQPNKLRPILRFEFWYPIDHTFAPENNFFHVFLLSISRSVISP